LGVKSKNRSFKKIEKREKMGIFGEIKKIVNFGEK